MKSDRHKKILELIADNNIGTQEELADALNKAGYNVTQATVSRDIRALNLNCLNNAAVIYKDEMVETNMDDIEIQIVLDY